MKNNYIPLGIAVVSLSAFSFFGGVKYQESKSFRPQMFSNGQDRFGAGNRDYLKSGNNNSGSQRGNIQPRNGLRPITGEITDSGDKSITVKTSDGGSKIIFVSSTTQINKASTGTLEDLKKGETVSVFGQENTDGSLVAQNIQLNPIARFTTPSATPTK